MTSFYKVFTIYIVNIKKQDRWRRQLQHFPTFFYISCVTRQIRASLTSNPTDPLTQISGLEVISVAATTAVAEGTTRPQVGIVVEPWAQTSAHPSLGRQNTGYLDWKRGKRLTVKILKMEQTKLEHENKKAR